MEFERNDLKDGYYINSLHYGWVNSDGYELIKSTVVSGPYDTAEEAQIEMELSFGGKGYNGRVTQELGDYAVSGPANKKGNIWGPWK